MAEAVAPELPIGNRCIRQNGTAPDQEDWRRLGQESLLRGRTVRWRNWTPPRDDWDHDHCAFRQAEISDRAIDGHTEYNAAWVTEDDLYWICATRFDDFRQEFDWEVEAAPPRR